MTPKYKLTDIADDLNRLIFISTNLAEVYSRAMTYVEKAPHSHPTIESVQQEFHNKSEAFYVIVNGSKRVKITKSYN